MEGRDLTRRSLEGLVLSGPLYLGVHTSLSGGESLHDVLASDLLRACNTVQVFLGSPQSLPAVRRLSDADLERCRARVEERDLRVFVHHPFVSNFARRDARASLARLAIEVQQVMRVVGRPERGAVVIHPGSACAIVDERDGAGRRSKKRRDATSEERRVALTRVARNLSQLGPERLAYVAIENAAGERGKLCSSLGDLRVLRDALPTVRFCIDTAHALGAGLCRFSTREQTRAFLHELDAVLGLSRLACVHLNDSRAEFGAHRDLHQRVGFGYAWSHDLSGLCELLRTCGRRSIPCIGENSLDALSDVILLRELFEAEALIGE